MDVEKGNIYKLLNGQCQYIIPVYQRLYSWQANVQCARLWKDIVEMEKKNKMHHFVGSIVCIAEKKSLMGVQKQLIIDGQQRLTTLSILMIALRDYLIEKGVDDVITDMVLKNHAREGDDAYKMLLTDTDREIMTKLVDGIKINEDENSLIYTNYLYFKQKVAEGVLSPDDIYNSISKLQIVVIILDKEQGDEPQLIFESLNSTGMDLSKSDLIRNYILMGLDNDKQKTIYKNYWRPFEKNFPTQDNSQRMDRFFRDYIVMKRGAFVKFEDIYEAFKDYMGNSEFSNSEEVAEDILTYGDLYTNITSESKKLPSSHQPLANLFEEIRSLRMEVAYPFLMRVYKDFISNVISIDEFAEILRLTISYVVRRAICEIPTNSLNKTFATMKNDIKADDYVNSIKAAYYFFDSYKRFPDDEEFKSSLCSRNMYKVRISKYMYVKLENEGNKEPIPYTGYTTEHILPQNKNMRDEWKEALGENYAEIQAKYLNSLGNLTLTRYNSEMGDKPFVEKLDVFKESAMHNLNKYVVQQTTWNEKTILKRAELLSECACKVWKAPVLNDETKEQYMPKEDTVKQTYDISNYDFDNLYVKVLYEKLLDSIMKIEPSTKIEYKKLYIAFKLKTNFVDVIVQKSRLRLAVNLDFDEVYDPTGICRDVTDLGRWGNGDVEIGFDSLSMLDDVMEIIKQSIEKQKI
ncbi:MAG: DUF262 domain-containing protein [Bacteroidaceae bacterium]|nr:DUF262 domain-containing protein [Bacteroidaceae bacterium]